MRIHIVMNVHAGTLRSADPRRISEQVVAAFTDAGHEVSIDLAEGPQLRECLVAAARRNDIDVLVACGGDGTISTAAGLLRHRPIALGVLPGGTMNMYARTLRLPLEPVAAAKVLAHGEVVDADGATAAGQFFLHQVSFGIQPHAIRRREQMKYGSRIEKLAAGARSLLATLRDPPQFTVEMVLDGDPRLLSTSALDTRGRSPTIFPTAASSASMPPPRSTGRTLRKSAPPWCSGAGRTTRRSSSKRHGACTSSRCKSW